MSLVRSAVRIAALQAIWNKTEAGDGVFDSQVGVLRQVEEGLVEHAPMIVVYTDEAAAEVTGRAALQTAGPTQLVFEVLVSLTPPGPREDGDPRIIIPETDGEMELLVDLIETQIRRALLDHSEWAEILDTLIDDWGRIRCRRATEVKGTRYAARQLIIEFQGLPEPMPTGEPEGVWATLIDALDAGGTTMQLQAEVFRAAFTGSLADWQAISLRYGLSEVAARALGVGTEVEGDPTIDEITAGAPLIVADDE